MADRRFWSNLAIVASLAGVYLTRLGQPQQEVLRLTFLETLANTAAPSGFRLRGTLPLGGEADAR